MKVRLLAVAALLTSGCTTTQSTDPSELTFEIPKGSSLTLNKALEIPANKTHTSLQFGKTVTDRERDDYKLNCRFDVKNFGPSTIAPETFKIRRSENGQEWISQTAGILRHYTDVYLDSEKGTDVIKLTCQEQAYEMDTVFSISDMKTALGDYFTFSFLTPVSAQ